ncbi:ClpX C4-type zinc finger protein [Sorangium sp. So ce204]|uniref:ClpX C4-type zinc finger protein n=1 Tax=Sorangium sp. So ce204 TaxID=3133288 RepID=UPI003F5DC055
MSGIWIDLSDRVAASDGVADARSQCSFCRREVALLERLIAAANVSICSACVQECARRLRRGNVLGWRPWWRFWKDGEPSKTRTGLSVLLLCGLALTVFGVGSLLRIPTGLLGGVHAVAAIALFVVRKAYGGLDGNLERFGIVHLFALALVSCAHTVMLVQRHP